MPLSKEAARRKDAITGGTVKFQHRHFAFIARIIASNVEVAKWDNYSTALAFAGALASTNPNFDRARFLAACGVEE